MIYQVHTSAVPNQFFTTTLDSVTWEITIETRLDNLYITLSNSDGLILANRICLDRTYLGHGFMFVDIEGDSNPTYDLLNTRYMLIWTDEL